MTATKEWCILPFCPCLYRQHFEIPIINMSPSLFGNHASYGYLFKVFRTFFNCLWAVCLQGVCRVHSHNSNNYERSHFIASAATNSLPGIYTTHLKLTLIICLKLKLWCWKDITLMKLGEQFIESSLVWNMILIDDEEEMLFVWYLYG